MKITKDFFPLVYSASKDVYEGKMAYNEGKQFLSSKGMNPNSAADYINDFKYMMDGVKFTRTLNAPSIDFLLENINKDFGTQKLSIALSALKAHIEYYESFGKGKLHKVKAVYEKYLKNQPTISVDEIEQNEIVAYLKEGINREQILNDLKNLKETDPEIISINHKTYKRDNKTVAQIKFIRNFQCQICNTSILKKDGTKYIEAAHIKAKNQQGRETPDNIILLCPNHHKEFDYSDLKIDEHSISNLTLTLNGRTYKLNLLIE
jgi:5-methylcytosine-specific restriction enzyme A